MLVFVLPAVLTAMLFKPHDDEDEDPYHKYGVSLAMYGMGMIPLLNSFGPAMWGYFDDDLPNYGYKITPITSAFEGVIKGIDAAIDVAQGEGDTVDAKNLIMGTSYVLGLPGNLIKNTVLGFDAWMRGEDGPEAVIYGPERKN